MGLVRKLSEFAGGVVHDVKTGWNTRRLREDSGFGLLDSEIDTGGNAPDREFRQTGRGIRDINRIKRERQLRIAWLLYLGYPLAYRGIELISDFVVGDGIRFQANDKMVQDIFVEFWQNNEWESKQHTRARELSLFGEMFLPVAVNKDNGAVETGFIDPLLVRQVMFDENNGEVPKSILLEPKSAGRIDGGPGPKPGQPIEMDVIRRDRDSASETSGMLQGNVLYARENHLSTTRGHSDLLSLIDWFDLHEQFLFTITEAAGMKVSQVWDITCRGADARTIRDLRKKFGDVKPGTSRWHNEQIEINNISPNLGTQELGEHEALLRRHIATGLGIPIVWLSETANTSAAASEMAAPTTRRLERRQKSFLQIIRQMFDFVIDQAIIHGRIPADIDRGFELAAPKIWVADTQRIASSMLTATQSLLLGEQQGWIDSKQASETFRFVASQIGVTMQDRGIDENQPGPFEDTTFGDGLERSAREEAEALEKSLERAEAAARGAQGRPTGEKITV